MMKNKSLWKGLIVMLAAEGICSRNNRGTKTEMGQFV